VNAPALLIRAPAVATMDRRGILRGDVGVAIARGRIVGVGASREIAALLPGHAATVDLDGAVLLPGLINAHTHLELSHCTPVDRPASFADWITSLPRRTGRGEPDFEHRVRAAVRSGARQSLRFGVTCVGDITAHPQITRPALRDGPLRVLSFGEALGLARARARFEQSLASAIDESDASEWLSIGLSPHAPYTVDLSGYRQCVSIARKRNLPLATHLAETPDEGPFLREQRGAFRDIWERLGSWCDGVETLPVGPVRFAHEIGLLQVPAVLAHVNYCDDADLSLLANGQASVVYCPRTHAYFGHVLHRWREMIDRGINVAVGTDSCASSPDLNVVDDLRRLWERHRGEITAEDVWALVTRNAAAALGLSDSLGTLSAGKLGDIVAFPMTSADDALEGILDDPRRMPLAVFVGGRRISESQLGDEPES
jgi:cytosine/adenosine deaminase-related metal-dependent hydrolase